MTVGSAVRLVVKPLHTRRGAGERVRELRGWNHQDEHPQHLDSPAHRPSRLRHPPGPTVGRDLRPS
jgi:hypothetical protein